MRRKERNCKRRRDRHLIVLGFCLVGLDQIYLVLKYDDILKPHYLHSCKML